MTALARIAPVTIPLRATRRRRAHCRGQRAGWTMDANERAVLAGLTRALLESGERTASLGQVFEGCGRRMPAPVLLEVLARLAEAGLVRHAPGGGAEVVAIGGAAQARLAAAPAQPEAWWITEAGFIAHEEAAAAEATALTATLPARLAAEGLGAREAEVWAELHDYLSWRPDRSVHLLNFGIGHRLEQAQLRRFQEALLRLGLLERAQAETHYRLTELGRRTPRLPNQKG